MPDAGRRGSVLQRLLHVLAGAEAAAGAGEDGDFQFVGVAEVGPGFREQRAHLVAERVEALGPVHPDDEDLSVAFGFDDGHGGVSRVRGS